MKGKTLFTIALASLSCVAPTQVLGDQGVLGVLLPGVGNSAPPAWVRLGLRLSYHVETATIAGLGSDWKEDEDGLWETPDHKRWSPSEKGSNAAEGIMQFDLTALGRTSAALLSSFYLVPRPGAAPQLSFQYPVIGSPATTGGLWVNPLELKKLQPTVTPTKKIVRMGYRIGTVTRPSVWIQSSNAQGCQVFVYDEATGILLHNASSVTAGPQRVTGKNETNTPSVTLSDGTLVNQRVLDLPWMSDSSEPWCSNPPPMSYSGSTTVPTAGGLPLVLTQLMTVKPKLHGEGWALFDVLLQTTNRIGMPSTTSPSLTISGLGQLGGAYIPPSALRALRKGQRIDSDQITGIVTTVQAVSNTEVVIVAANGAQTLTWGYDLRSGLLSRIEKADHSPFAPIKTQLRLSGK